MSPGSLNGIDKGDERAAAVKLEMSAGPAVETPEEMDELDRKDR